MVPYAENNFRSDTAEEEIVNTHVETDSHKPGITQGSTTLITHLSPHGTNAQLKIATTGFVWEYHMNERTVVYHSFCGSMDLSAVTFIDSRADTKMSCGET